MESSRIPFLEEWLLFRRGIVMRGKTRGEEKDLSAQRIQFNTAMQPPIGAPWLRLTTDLPRAACG